MTLSDLSATLAIVLGAGAAANPPITAVAFAPDGRTVVSASQAGVHVCPMEGPGLTPPAPRTSGGAGTLPSPNAGRGELIPASGDSRSPWPSRLPNLHALAFHPGGALLAVGGGAPGQSGAVELRAWPGGSIRRTITGHRDVVMAVAFSPDGTRLATAGADGTIRVLTVATSSGRTGTLPVSGRAGGEVTLTGHVGPVLGVAFSQDGRWLASGGADRSVKLWEIATGRLVRTLSQHLGAVHAVAFQPNGRLLATAGADASVRIWQPEIGRLVRIVRGHDGPVLDVGFTPDGSQIVSACADGRVRLIAGDSDAILQVFERGGPGSKRVPVHDVAVSQDGRQFVAGCVDGWLWLWER